MNLFIPIALLAVAIIIGVILRVVRMPFYRIVLVVVGAVIGLLLGALFSIPAANLPAPFGTIMPVVISLALTIGAVIAVLTQSEYLTDHIPQLKRLSEMVPGQVAPEV